MRWAAAHPTLSGLQVSADLLGSALLMFSVPVWLLLGRDASPRLAWAGAVAGVFGLAGQVVIHGVEIAGYLVAVGGADPVAFDRAVNAADGGLPLIVFMLMFFGGGFVGTTLSLIALWRARTLPRGSILLWLLFLLANVASLPVPTTVLSAAALCWMAAAVARAGTSRLP
jgi:hypothetical protein